MITIEPNIPPTPVVLRPDEQNHPTLDDDILNEDKADSAPERTAEEFREDELKDAPPPTPDEARA